MSLSFSARLAAIPPGAGVLFFIQIFATLGFAVLYSSLVLYATGHLKFSAEKATLIMGVFGAFNYGLHLFGGYLGGRFLSNRNLFVGGMVLQLLGCATMTAGTTEALLWGLALFLTGSGLNVTCLNMMLTQRFAPEDNRREAAFLWNYAGMNIGFFVGFTVAGHYQLTQRYTELFWFATLGNAVAIVLALFYWRVLADINTPLLQASRREFLLRLAVGMAILLGLVPLLWFLLQNPQGTEYLVKAVSAGVALALVVLTLRHKDLAERKRMWAYLILTLGSLMFWSLYQMAPSGLQLFAVGNVKLELWGVTIAPQWVQNINTVVIVLGGPLLAAWFARLRERGWPVDVPQQFAASLLLMGLGFLVLPLGIALADGQGKVAFSWLFTSYVLQALGELLISPVGYAMIGRLAPRQYQGVMMGSWMLVTGLASLFAADFSGSVAQPEGGSALVSNPAYASLFTQLGLGSVLVGVLLIVLVPRLRRLIGEPKQEPV
ncbi:POT family proton-dependent oligopeptide transporter [Paucibacter oligotrophus]|uniref:POT family proton-dependent oligopeptide transporter n=1 Tax=Roseateles oligotrophus TaxID=1769250 RepID=A0A840LJB4_9BURK|nr:oligopeptide:H+ symporter [Roseateles oligotrophus]MBB4845367.1 POT family proton-dependent oligopeptide transporter [Roseateles oligotrophus]